MSVHSWCRDVQRDEAVRAAEDGRQGRLPTLEECIAGARAMMPKSVSATSAPEQENKGNGMRTERVTLEVTHDLDAPLGDWIVQVIDESLGFNESVRVVEECCLDRINMGEVIRERDELRAQVQILDGGQPTAPSDLGVWCTAKDLSARCKELAARLVRTAVRASTAEARVAELESCDWVPKSAPAASVAANSPAGPKSLEPVAWGIVNELGKRIAVIDEEPSDGWLGCTFVPLYAAAPPARGWLTEEERDLIAGITDDDDYTEEGQNIAKALLARSSPPEVVLPSMPDCSPMADYGAAWSDCLIAVRESLRRAGVKVQQPLPPEVEANG